jgi:hypothetical protein
MSNPERPPGSSSAAVVRVQEEKERNDANKAAGSGLRPPRVPQGIVLAVEEAKARGRLYPIIVLYSSYAVASLTQALRGHAWTALEFFGAGLTFGMVGEYCALGRRVSREGSEEG